jgi:hypothetical protein
MKRKGGRCSWFLFQMKNEWRKTMDGIKSLVGITQTVQNANVATVESQPKPTSRTGFDTYSKAISETFGATTAVPSDSLQTDKASPRFFQRCAAGTHIPSIVLHLYR